MGYTIAIYAVFAIMALSSWCIEVQKNDAWAELSELEQYVLTSPSGILLFPVRRVQFRTLLQLDAHIRRAVRTREKACATEGISHHYFKSGDFYVRFVFSLQVDLYALGGTLVGAVAFGMLLWVLLLL